LANYKKALDAFTLETGGTISQLKKTIPDFRQLLEGMVVAINYLAHENIRMNEFPPSISFEITTDGQIRLYAWEDGNDDKVGMIKTLKNNFDAFFKKQTQDQNYYLTESQRLYEASAFKDCLELLDEAASLHENLGAEWYLRKGQAYIGLVRFIN